MISARILLRVLIMNNLYSPMKVQKKMMKKIFLTMIFIFTAHCFSSPASATQVEDPDELFIKNLSEMKVLTETLTFTAKETLGQTYKQYFPFFFVLNLLPYSIVKGKKTDLSYWDFYYKSLEHRKKYSAYLMTMKLTMIFGVKLATGSLWASFLASPNLASTAIMSSKYIFNKYFFEVYLQSYIYSLFQAYVLNSMNNQENKTLLKYLYPKIKKFVDKTEAEANI